MKKKHIWLLIFMMILTVVSTAALFYRSVVLESFALLSNEKDEVE